MFRNTNPFNQLNIRALVVDFLGGLVPGIIFTGFSVLLLGIMVFSIIELIELASQSVLVEFNVVTFIDYLKLVAGSFRIEIFIFFIIISYVFGHVFYRQDLKFPDLASFKKIKSELIAEKKLKTWVARTEQEVLYPYTNLYNYLVNKGLTHLSPMVGWQRKTRNDMKIKRTKFFIGILKIRLLYHRPEQCTPIVRNEAHVRLSSTTWYLAQSIRKMCFAALLLNIIVIIFASYKEALTQFPDNVIFFMPLLVVIFILILMSRLISIIEKFFHYQRVREIVFVLETAYAFFREFPDQVKDIFPHLHEYFLGLQGSDKLPTNPA